MGKYVVKRRLADGGFGTLLEAWDPDIKRRVAIKTCSSTDPENRQRFQREAEIAGRLDHPNIVRIFDFGIADGTPFLVEEFLAGSDLDVLIHGHHLSLPEKMLILLQIARGLEHAHGQGIVHRDVKPSNVRILEDGTAKLMDFGIASLLETDVRITRQGMTSGTAAYLAPEQIKGDAGSAQTDIFAFGVLAFELLCSRRPFDGSTISTVLFQILNEDPPPLSHYWPRAPVRLQKIVHRCLEKNPADRWQSMSSILAALAEARDSARRVNHEPTLDATENDGLDLASGSTPTDLADVSIDAVSPPRDHSAGIGIGSRGRAPRRWLWLATPVVIGGLAALALAEVRGDLQLRQLVTELRAQRQATAPPPSPAPPPPDSSFSTNQVPVEGSSVRPSPTLDAAHHQPDGEADEPEPDNQVSVEAIDVEPAAVDAPRSAVVRFSRLWHPKLQVRVDRAPARLLAAVNELELDPGEHALRFELTTPVYRSAKTVHLRLGEGERRTIRCPIEPPGAISVQAGLGSRQGQVTIDGSVFGKSPVRRVFLEPGGHTVTIHFGSAAWGRKVESKVVLQSAHETIVTFDHRQPQTVLTRQVARGNLLSESLR